MLALKYAALIDCLIHTLGYLEMRLILSHFKKILILGALPKSFLSDFVLKIGKTPYIRSIDDTVDSKKGS